MAVTNWLTVKTNIPGQINGYADRSYYARAIDVKATEATNRAIRMLVGEVVADDLSSQPTFLSSTVSRKSLGCTTAAKFRVPSGPQSAAVPFSVGY